MEKKVLLKRMKGLLALVLAFLMLFGNGMTVLAADYCVKNGITSCVCGFDVISEGKIVHGGDTIHMGSAGYQLILDGNLRTQDINNMVILPGDSNTTYKYTRWSHEKCWFESYVAPEVDPAAHPAGNGTSHEHSYEWVETLEPSVSGDGMMQHKCSCGSVDDQYTIPGSLAYFRMFCAAIQNAPENGTVEWNPYAFRCYTRRMMEELAKRPDVTLRTTYTEADGTTKSFTIPAGQALTDEEMFYGFTYLGNRYGWN